jgi:hypothetical protein
VQDKYTACSTGVLTINQFLNLLIIRIASEVQTSGRSTKEIDILLLYQKSQFVAPCDLFVASQELKKGANCRVSGPHDTL